MHYKYPSRSIQEFYKMLQGSSNASFIDTAKRTVREIQERNTKSASANDRRNHKKEKKTI